jgi:hypothetical protein
MNQEKVVFLGKPSGAWSNLWSIVNYEVLLYVWLY